MRVRTTPTTPSGVMAAYRASADSDPRRATVRPTRRRHWLNFYIGQDGVHILDRHVDALRRRFAWSEYDGAWAERHLRVADLALFVAVDRGLTDQPPPAQTSGYRVQSRRGQDSARAVGLVHASASTRTMRNRAEEIAALTPSAIV